MCRSEWESGRRWVFDSRGATRLLCEVPCQGKSWCSSLTEKVRVVTREVRRVEVCGLNEKQKENEVSLTWGIKSLVKVAAAKPDVAKAIVSGDPGLIVI